MVEERVLIDTSGGTTVAAENTQVQTHLGGRTKQFYLAEHAANDDTVYVLCDFNEYPKQPMNTAERLVYFVILS